MTESTVIETSVYELEVWPKRPENGPRRSCLFHNARIVLQPIIFNIRIQVKPTKDHYIEVNIQLLRKLKKYDKKSTFI